MGRVKLILNHFCIVCYIMRLISECEIGLVSNLLSVCKSTGEQHKGKSSGARGEVNDLCCRRAPANAGDQAQCRPGC